MILFLDELEFLAQAVSFATRKYRRQRVAKARLLQQRGFARCRPVRPAEISRSHDRRVHSRAQTTLRQNFGRTFLDCAQVRLAPEIALPARLSIHRLRLARQPGHNSETLEEEFGPRRLRRVSIASTPPQPGGRKASHLAAAKTLCRTD